MQLTTIVFLFLILRGVLCFQTEKINSVSKFYNKLDELFEAFNQNDTERMEDVFKALNTVNPNELNKLLNANSTTDYTRGLHNYVVS